MPLSRWAAILAAGLLTQQAALAQAAANPDPASQASQPSPVFVIKGFNIQGENPLPQGETTRVLAPFLRADATLETLQKATQALESALREKGFALHRVALPPQEIGATVTLNIVKFVIGKVTIEGREKLTESNVRNSLPELVEGQAPNFRTLAVQTAIANENQGKNVQVALKEAEEADQIDARIVVKESKPWNFNTSLANSGSASTGADRFTLAGTHANVFGLDHQFTGAYTTSLERISDVKQIGLNYRIPMYRWGGVIGLNYTKSDVVGNNGAFTSTGAGSTMGINYNYYLPPDGGYRGYFNLGLDDKVFAVTLINGVPIAGQVDRRSRPLTVGYYAKAESDTSVWGYNADLAFNVAGGAGNDLAAYRTEDVRITNANWSAVRGGANYLSSFAGGWLWSMRGNFQYSPDALISGEQFGLGGSTSVRGTTERPIAGDSGLFASTEISTKELMPGLRLLGFVDAGWLTNKDPNANPKPASDSLSSVGLGLRFSSPAGYAISADFARLMSGSVLPINTGIPQAGDQRLHINFTARF